MASSGPIGQYCTSMCPPEETKMRLENDLVHKLELSPGGQGHHAFGTNFAAYRLVKKFSRSAAGHKISMGEVRSPRQCLNTAQYLVKEFVCREGQLDKTRYDFVLDRLKAVRQDLSVRGCRDDRAAEVLRICVRFHLYAGYRLCTLDAANFDPVTNFAQCLDCLKSLLTLRQEVRSNDNAGQGEAVDGEDEDMSAVYLMLNLGSTDSIKWALTEDKTYRSLPSVSLSLRCNFCLLERNYVRLFRLVRKLPILALLAFHWKFPLVMLDTLTVMSTAYNSKVLSFPVQHFSKMFCLDQNQDFMMELCRRCDLETTQDNSRIMFKKKSFNGIKLPHFQSEFINKRLDSLDLEHLLLWGQEDDLLWC